MKYNYIINSQYNYCIYNDADNVEVPGATTTACLKRRLLNFLSNVTAKPASQMTNPQSTLRTASDLCKNVSLAVLATVIHIVSTKSQYRDAGRKK